MLDFGNIFDKLDIENGEIECFQKYINYIQEYKYCIAQS